VTRSASRWRHRLTARRRQLATTAVVGLGLGTLAYAAATDPGYSPDHLDPNDGAVWVTNDVSGHYGRLSTASLSLDTAFPALDAAAQGHQLDVLQSGRTVLARDRAAGQVTPVDVLSGTLVPDHTVNLPSSTLLAVGARTTATLDPDTGTVRAAVAGGDGPASVDGLSPDLEPLATVALAPGLPSSRRTAGLAVTDQGTVLAVGSAGELLTLTPDSAGTLSASTSTLGGGFQDVQVTAAGNHPVVVDTTGLAAVLPGRRRVSLPTRARDAVLQAGPAGEREVLLTTPAALLALDLDSGAVRTLFTGGTGPAAAPVTAGGCRYAAWAGSPGVAVRSCGDEPARRIDLEDGSELQSPQVRVNRRSVVLNDAGSGGLWDVSTGRRLDNWTSVVPPPSKETKATARQQAELARSRRTPRAVADALAARPGRTSILHLLDNDANPAGSVLSIREVSAARPRTATLSVAPDGQSVQIAMNPGSGTVTFTYTIDDAAGNRSSAPVVVQARRPTQNGPPAPRAGYVPQNRSVADSGRLNLPVIGDWRDPDADPVALVEAFDGKVPVGVSADGRLHYVAPATAGTRQVRYLVSDGTARTEGRQSVTVLSKAATAAAAAPVTSPDVARGEAGSPITVRPLDNDLPGTDPTTPSAQLALAGDVVAPDGTTVTTDIDSGEVTLLAGAPGTYLLTYTAAFGDAPYARGTIRVDVAQRAGRVRGPTAMLDQAVVHGTNPAVVDVLANDFDPSGRLLAVQSARSADPDSVEVAVLRGRWVRIQSLRPTLAPDPQRIRYTVTDGVTGTATGEIVVQQFDAPGEPAPEPADDVATVRSQDTVTIPVLDNDLHPSGEPLRLVTGAEGAEHAGLIDVRGPDGTDDTDSARWGRAYATGTVVRYEAPAVTEPLTVALDYVVEDPQGNRASATGYVTVVPLPTAERPDAAPSPPQVQGRVVAGDTTTIQLRTSGVDPDGDSVTLRGITGVPAQGRILATTPSSITYQAYPTSAETDVFQYTVADRFGQVGTGTVRIAVLPPGDPQPPVAVDDYVTARPGTTLALDILANDIAAIGDVLEVEPLGPYNPGLGDRARVDPGTRLLTVTTPHDLAPLTVRYAVRGNSGALSFAAVHVRAADGVNLPPVAHHAVAEPTPGATSVTLDVLAAAQDPDGGHGRLRVTRVDVPGATISGGRVTLPVTASAQIVPYEIADRDGGLALGAIYVTGSGGGAPRGRPDSLIKVAKNAATRVVLRDVVTDPAGKPVTLAAGGVLSASPKGKLTVQAAGPDGLEVTAAAGYVGPASIAFAVTHGPASAASDGERALLTVPVQVGPETPVLRCPDTSLPLVVGGNPRPIEITGLCHVWTARPEAIDDLQFSGRFPQQEPGLTVSDSGRGTLVVAAGGSAVPGTQADLVVTVPGTEAVPATLRVRVARAPAPVLAPIRVPAVRAGTSRTIDIAGHLRSQLGRPRPTIIEISKVSGAEARAEKAGPSTLVVTPAGSAHGRITYRLTVSDVSDTTQTERRGTGLLTVDVLGYPDAPGRPAPAGKVASRQVTLSWKVPPSNGLPIDYSTVTWDGGKQRCAASPCTITGLENGRPYSFTVVAHNGIGDSPASPASAPLVPDAVPGPPGNPATANPADGRLQVSWTPATVDGTPVTKYLVTWPGGSAETPGTTVVATGLDNLARTTFTIKAYNLAGWGPPARVTGQSAGTPARPDAPRVSGSATDGGADQVVAVRWDTVSPNGPGPTTYTVTRSGSGDTQVLCDRIQATDCTAPAVPTDGTPYAYTVTAHNPVADSVPSAAATLVAAAAPGDFSGLSATATGVSRQVRLRFVSPPAHDAGLTITCTVGGAGCGRWTASSTPTGFDEVVTAPRDGEPATFTLEATNTTGSTRATVTSDTVHGPLGPVQITSVSAQGPDVSFDVSADAAGLPAKLTVTVAAGGSRVGGWTEDIGIATFSRHYSVKAGYSTDVSITADVDRGDSQASGRASQSTGAGKASLSCTAGAAGTACTGGTVTVHVSDLTYSSQITCQLRSAAGSASVGMQTDSRGSADTGVPAGTLTVRSGTTYTVSCDDSRSPSTPVTATWTAP
jgi:hypothetical protein